MSALPSGTVTFLFTDIEGSTRLWEERPDAMRVALARHDDLLRETIATHKGHVFKTMGDAFCAVFPRAADAVAAALSVQQELHRAQRAAAGAEGEPALKVRMAVHTGEVEEREGEYSGPVVSRVARLLATGYGNQVLLSVATEALVHDVLPAGASLRDLGSHRLRDLQRPEQVFQLLHPDLAAEFPPLRSLESVPNNLPRQLTSFIGRERELHEVKRLLGEANLVTLTGVGGCGKTRLALQVAAEVVQEYADGAWLIELAGLEEPSLAPQQVMRVLGVREQPGQTPTDTLIEFLKPQSLLLVLDNCEHLLAECARLADALLRRCPRLRIIATSRETLGVAGEWTYRVPSLSLPDPDRLPPPDRLQEFAAVRLFADRAALSLPSFAMTAANRSAVAQVCCRLDGIPFAIELAAARVRTLSPEQIAARLDDRFRLLTAGNRTALPRHQTLRALIDWSYVLLAEPEQKLLQRLSVFAGGFTLEAAEAICGNADDSGNDVSSPLASVIRHLSSDEILDLLALLVDKSLVMYEEPSGAEVGRYRLLETVRQYSRDRLEEGEDAEEVRRRHRAWFLALSRRASGPVRVETADWLAQMDTERDNVRSALAWSLRNEEGEVCLQIVAAPWLFWYYRGYWSEGRQWLERALALPDAASPTPARSYALRCAGKLAYLQGDLAAAEAMLEESLAILRGLNDTKSQPPVLNALAEVARVRGDYAQTRLLFEESLTILRAMGDRGDIAWATQALGEVALEEGDPSAQALLEEGLAFFRERGSEAGTATALVHLAELARRRGDGERASALCEESLALRRSIGHKSGISRSLNCLGRIAVLRGEITAARAYHEEALTLRQELGDRAGAAECLEGLAETYLRSSQEPEVDEEVRRRRVEGATRVFGAAQAMRDAAGIPLTPAARQERDGQLADARAALGEAKFAAAWAEGQAMSPEQALAALAEG
jgi:predicted ATPase/class 3 adenylate cyclase